MIKNNNNNILLLVLILIITIYKSNSISIDITTVSPTTPSLYANFIPYQDEQCSGEVKGIGLSIFVGPCIYDIGSIAGYQDKSTSYSLFINALRVGIEQFDNVEGENGKCDGNFTNFYSFKNGTCNLTPPFLIDNNGTIVNGLPISQQYSKFSITKTPFFGLNNNGSTQIYTQYSSSNNNINNECQLKNYLYSMYFTNNLEIKFNSDNSGGSSSRNVDGDNISINYSCNENKKPIRNICKSNGECNNESVSIDCLNDQSIYCI